jgi:hypothetical protein
MIGFREALLGICVLKQRDQKYKLKDFFGPANIETELKSSPYLSGFL